MRTPQCWGVAVDYLAATIAGILLVPGLVMAVHPRPDDPARLASVEDKDRRPPARA